MSTAIVGYTVADPSRLGSPSPLLCDNIDPKSHDYVSLFTTIDPIDAQVIIALKVVRNSGPSVAEDGSRLRDVKKMTDSAQNEIRSLVREALSRLIANRDIRYEGTTFSEWSTDTQTGNAVVNWINLRARDDIVRSAALEITPPEGA